MAAAKPLPVASDVKSDGEKGRRGTENESAVLPRYRTSTLAVLPVMGGTIAATWVAEE